MVQMRRLTRVTVALAVVMGCLARCKDPAATVDASPPVVATSTGSVSSVPPVPTPTPTREALEPPPPATDAGIAGCAFVVGKTKLSLPGPYAAVTRASFVELYAQDHGAPALAGSLDLVSGAVASHEEPRATRQSPPCASAGSYLFCMNTAGEIRRYRLSGAKPESDNFIAHARAGAGIAATLAATHTLVAYLRDRTTSEGVVTEAYVENDDGTELRLSEDGAGATSVELVTRGEGALGAYVDARRGMSPVHARTLTLAPKLALGKDAVVFVAGSAEPNTRVSLGIRGATAYALLPVAHELQFGLGIVKFDGEPPTDAPVVWSDYPNGLDPAPLAATVADAKNEYVARVRPSAPKYGSPRVLEIGQLDVSGAFSAFGIVPTEGAALDVTMVSDGSGGFVLAYTDAGGGWVERLKCAHP